MKSLEPKRPTAEEMLERAQLVPASERSQAQAWLRIYLGYAPGVGKTYAMLHEGRRRKERGTDVVVGYVETYDRPLTKEAIGDLEILSRKQVPYRGVVVEEMDVDAILARRPQVVLIDELAHTNVPGSKHEKRYQDVLEVRDAGINVITTVNIQHLESLKDTVERVTGIHVRESLPDWVLDGADEVELIDQTPEALQKRMLHGNIYPKSRIDDALQHFFRKGNLTALRELALRRVAEKADDQLQQYMRGHGIDEPWHCTERVLVCVPPTSQAQQLVRRGFRLAERLRGELTVLHISQGRKKLDPKVSQAHQEVQKALQLAQELGAEVVSIESDEIADALVSYANEHNVTQIVMGESTKSWFQELLHGSIVRQVLARSKDVDVHIVQRAESG
ncbi:MAG TPA: universal stress protein [Chloroflexota bacterium]|nr:universal stress protein [Chloroflexota bacterium]